MHAAYVTRVHYLSKYARSTSAVIFFAAKTEKIFREAIMAEQVPCFQLAFDFLNVENSDYFEESSREVACNFTKNRSLLIKSRSNFFV